LGNFWLNKPSRVVLFLGIYRMDGLFLKIFFPNHVVNEIVRVKLMIHQHELEVPRSLEPPVPPLILPSDLTDVELFRQFCMPLNKTDLWVKVAWL
jgi:hypothetical protein